MRGSGSGRKAIYSAAYWTSRRIFTTRLESWRSSSDDGLFPNVPLFQRVGEVGDALNAGSGDQRRENQLDGELRAILADPHGTKLRRGRPFLNDQGAGF